MTKKLLKTTHKIKKTVSFLVKEQKVFTPEEEEFKTKCEKDFFFFVKNFFPVITGEEFVDGIPPRAMCLHLQKLFTFEISNLIINIAPRTGKSFFMSVMFPAWVWTHSPRETFLYTSYQRSISTRDSVACRDLIMNPEYQKYWGHTFRLREDFNTKMGFYNTEGGFRLASSLRSGNMGHGARFLFCDDPNDLTRFESDEEREWVYNIWRTVLMSRSKDERKFSVCIGQQRTHSYDLTGHIIEDDAIGKWTHLFLPMEYEKDWSCTTYGPTRNDQRKKIWVDPRKKEKQLLWPEKIDAQTLINRKADYGWREELIAGQLQQRPAPAGGGLIKKEWIRAWHQQFLPAFDLILQSWDTALNDGDSSCFSACTTWGVFYDAEGQTNVMLLTLFKDRIQYPELRKRAMLLSRDFWKTNFDDKQFSERHKPNKILIEQKVSGYCLYQDLRKTGIPVAPFNPNPYGSKLARAHTISHLFENGRVWFRTKEPHYRELTDSAMEFYNEAILFPQGKTNDVVDSASQALIWLMENNLVESSYDIPPPSPGLPKGTPVSYF